LGILAKGSDGVFLRNTGRLIELENDKYIIKKYQPIDLCGNHFILFHRPNSQKDIYYVYQSWQSEFSLEYWM